MLHVFDALNGEEVYSYVPSMVWDSLSEWAKEEGAMRYFVDGGLSVAEAELSSGQWRKILVGGLGEGGRGAFILDVSEPNLSAETNSGPLFSEDRKILWELKADNDEDLGHIHGRPGIAQLNDGRWYAVLGNGYRSSRGYAVLYLVSLDTGAVSKISTGEGGGNGLSSPALVDSDGDGKVDIVYAGDIKGTLWAFTFNGGRGTSALSSALPNAIYRTYSAITGAPDVARHPLGGHMIYFATGRLLSVSDIVEASSGNAIYGIWDDRAREGEVDVRQVSISREMSIGDTDIRTLLEPAADINWQGADANSGWKISLPPGERVISAVAVKASRLNAIVIEPESQKNWLIEADYLDGGAYSHAVFDLNGDGILNAEDRIDGNLDGDQTDSTDVPMAIALASGWVSPLVFATIDEKKSVVLLNAISDSEHVCVDRCNAKEEWGFDRQPSDFDHCKDIDSGDQQDGIAGCKSEFNHWREARGLDPNGGKKNAPSPHPNFDSPLFGGIESGALTLEQWDQRDYHYGRQNWVDLREE